MGSYGYMPLEQFGGQTKAASDLYSLGMTLIYLLTGHHPAELIGNNGEIKFDRSNLSNQFSHWLDKMIQSHLDKRFDSARSAKIMLKSNTEENRDFGHLKFANNLIQVDRNQDVLRIEFYKVLLPGEKPTSGLAGMFNFTGLLLFILFVYAYLSPIFGSFSLFLAIIIFLIIHVVYSTIYRNYVGFKILDIRKTTRSLRKSASNKIKYKNSKAQHFDSKSVIDLLIYHTGQKSYPELSIHLGKKEYAIFDEKFSAEVLHLLGQELSDFLDLPLQVIQ